MTPSGRLSRAFMSNSVAQSGRLNNVPTFQQRNVVTIKLTLLPERLFLTLITYCHRAFLLMLHSQRMTATSRITDRRYRALTRSNKRRSR